MGSSVAAVNVPVGRIAARRPFSAGLGYSAIAVVFFRPLLAQLRSRILADDALIQPGQSDAFNALWTYWWDQKAVMAGRSPLFCDWIFPPGGADLRWHTHVLLPTLLTLPVRGLLGTVGAYNVMVLALLVGGACVVERFLRTTLALSSPAAFFGGAMFGFSPYFVFKAHRHPNLVGAVFWGAALATLLGAYIKSDFSARRGLLFAVALWATFWTSFVEVTMLAVVLAATVLVFEIGRRRARPPDAVIAPRRRLLFFAPAVVGAVSLVPFLVRGDAEIVRMPVVMPLSPAELIHFPRLSVLASLGSSTTFEFWGTYVPLAMLLPALYGMVVAIRGRERAAKRLAVMPLLCLAFTVNALGVPGAIVRALPLGEGFRVFARFFPFLLFFLAIFAAIGVDRLFARIRSSGGRWVIGVALVAVAGVELYPVHLGVSPVRSLALGADARRGLDASRPVFVVPRGDYVTSLDTYQIDLDLPFVRVSYLARQDRRAAMARLRSFPRVFGPRPKAFNDPELLRELAKLDVGYMLFEERPASATLPRGHAIAELDHQLLWALDSP